MSRDTFAMGFVKTAAKHGLDPMTLAGYAASIEKIAYFEENIVPTRKLDRSERKELLSHLPENRKKQIIKFLLEELRDDKKKSYVVKAKDNDKSKGEYTYIPEDDALFESDAQKERNSRARYNRAAWGRAFMLGFI